MDTIFAQASAPGKAGVAVIRISGPQAWEAVAALTDTLPEPRVASLRRLSFKGEFLDEALVLLFPKGSSFTGESVAELQIHGAIATTAAVLRSLSEMQACRMAEPGEFTRRALENGRLDLTQVEGLADLIDAETEAQRKQALRVLSGEIGQQVERWRERLVRAAALLEATIDFADEDVPVDVTPEVTALIDEVMADLRTQIQGFGAAERIRDGFEVAIVGRPNVGKSTLLNALAGREAAITSEIAGTTRDVIEVRMDLGGLPVTFLDTAGLREATDEVESIGIQRAIDRSADADLRVFLVDGKDVLPMAAQDDDLIVQAKADLREFDAGLAISGVTKQGIAELMSRTTRILSKRSLRPGTITRERHRISATTALETLERSRNHVAHDSWEAELAAEDLRRAIRALEGLVGRVDVEDLLDQIFSSFCIGK